jgi:hypothetical protein
MTTRIFLYVCFFITSFVAFGQNDNTIVAFRIKLVDNKDTLTEGFDFYLAHGAKTYFPLINDSLKCYEFNNVDDYVDFKLKYKNQDYTFKDIYTKGLISDNEWTVSPNSNATQSCYEMWAEQVGCFQNVFLGPSNASNQIHGKETACENKSYIYISSFQPRQHCTVTIIETKKEKKKKKP